ncbi:hypothetical protein SAMN05661091_3002 [Paenibacillus uliginis N3/975]|uniref:Uncharacterized protein n=1 Tax=Paenibacillus uliginis N3/975 TaxID=1313296 RepID=A0A1X7HFB5_9BACL|nr:hypothetical protein SAMN05661091_3002 [Paenibacillus uliginis N3/975]
MTDAKLAIVEGAECVLKRLYGRGVFVWNRTVGKPIKGAVEDNEGRKRTADFYLIRPHKPLFPSKNGRFGTVQHMQLS